MEPIVPRETIRALARQAADAGHSQHDANPYPAGSDAHARFEHDYQEHLHAQDAEVV